MKKNTISKQTIIDNIELHYRRYKRNPDFISGLSWYDRAKHEIREHALREGIAPDILAGIVAVLSPRLPWDKNIIAAVNFISGEACQGTGSNKRKASKILEENDDSVIRGRKVSNFYNNLLGDLEGVTIDTWMIRIALGDPYWKNNISEKLYDAISEGIRVVARRHHVAKPARLQSGLWEAYRREYANHVYNVLHGFEDRIE